MNYLKLKQYYIDLYDRFTVERCRRMERSLLNPEDPIIYEGKELKGDEKKRLLKAIAEFGLYFIKGEEFERKESTIQKWMKRDGTKDDLLESARPPEGIRCLSCNSSMDMTYKHLHDWDDKGDRVLFMYDCPQGHLPRRAFFSDGEEWKHSRPMCPECSAELDESEERSNQVIITTQTCSSCNYKNTFDLDLAPKKEEEDKNFIKDRERFCLTEKEGGNFVGLKYKLEEFSKFIKEHEEKEKHKEDYEKVDKLKKLTVIELEDLLTPIFEKEGYSKLQFGAPDMGKDLFLPFTVYDTKSDRRDRDSSLALQKLSRQALEKTNWRLMSDGISYRSGILTGRFRAYEREEDLLKLIKSDSRV